MNGTEGCAVITYKTEHPHLAVASSVVWDHNWQIPVYDEGRWVVGIIRSSGGYNYLVLNGEVPTWPKAIATQICNELAQAGAYLGEARDREVNDHNREARCLHAAFELHSAWRGKTDADYEAAGADGHEVTT